MKKILVIFGTRPEAIKMAPVINALKRSQSIEVKVCVTGQHRKMLDQVLSAFEIYPEYDLSIMEPNQTLSDITARVLTGVTKILNMWMPDSVLVHGDTTTSFAASLAAFYLKIPIGHVEAGLRTGNKSSPWPEEVNRCLTAVLAKWHFAPTAIAAKNLAAEGVPIDSIFVTGNTVIDALLYAEDLINHQSALKNSICQELSFLDDSKRLILVTGHRRENFGDGIRNLCLSLKKLSERGDVQIVYPVHLNPNIKLPVMEMLGSTDVHLIEPQDYFPFVYLMTKSYLIITDSGGIQEEAPSLRRPVLVTRVTTERPEALETGAIRLVGSSATEIFKNANQLLDNYSEYEAMAGEGSNPYGDGKAAQRIADILEFQT